MNKQLTDYLKELDFSESELKLYFTLLELGPMNVRNLAHNLGFKRTTVYNYIAHLLEKGLIMKLVSGSKTLMVANQPEEILPHLIEQKVQAGKKMQETLPQFLTAIQESISPNDSALLEDVQIKYYKGVISARKIYEEALRADELHSYIRIDREESLFPNNANVFDKAFKENKKLKVWEIIYDTELSAPPSEASRSQKGRYFYKYMLKSQRLSSEDILIYDGKVAVINFRGGKTSIVLQSRDLYNNFKDIFNFLWDMLPEPKQIKS